MSQARDYRLGVVLVHGMGEQQRGDTITPIGDALIGWLKRRVAGAGIEVVVRRATLRASEGPGPAAAELEVAFETTLEAGKPDSNPTRWLIRESHWADAFRQATFLETAVWLITVGPWLITSQLIGVRRRASAVGVLAEGGVLTWLVRAVTSTVLTFVAAVATAAMMPLILLLGVLSVLPIPVLQDVAAAAQRNLAGSFGDLALLVRSPSRFAAMWSRVERDVRDVHAQCDAVVVIAHSQGAAVSWQAIRRLQAPATPDERVSVPLLITYGQALRKLKLLYIADHEASPLHRLGVLLVSLVSTAGLIALVVLVWAIWTQAVAGETVDVRLWYGGAAVVLGTFLVQHTLGLLVGTWDDAAEVSLRGEIADVSEANRSFRWIDLWASADPAPNGPLLHEPAPQHAPDVGDVVDSYKVRNLGSTLIDHTVYWSNSGEFIPAIVAGASALAASLGCRTPTWTEVAARARLQDRLVHLLVAGRVAYWAATITILMALYPSWAAIGGPAVEALQNLPGPPDPGAPDEVVNRWVGAAIIAGIAAAVWFAITKLWRSTLTTSAWLPGGVPGFGTRAMLWTIGELVVLAGLAFVIGRLDGSVVVFLLVTAVGSAFAITILAAGGRRLGEQRPTRVWDAPPRAVVAVVGAVLFVLTAVATVMAIAAA
ncbi:MAG: hypothetical protein M3406_12420 [Chloroflexota bacterium]|nr:hypothetical protein [Chloroflexota bacterium]